MVYAFFEFVKAALGLAVALSSAKQLVANERPLT